MKLNNDGAFDRRPPKRTRLMRELLYEWEIFFTGSRNMREAFNDTLRPEELPELLK